MTKRGVYSAAVEAAAKAGAVAASAAAALLSEEGAAPGLRGRVAKLVAEAAGAPGGGQAGAPGSAAFRARVLEGQLAWLVNIAGTSLIAKTQLLCVYDPLQCTLCVGGC